MSNKNMNSDSNSRIILKNRNIGDGDEIFQELFKYGGGIKEIDLSENHLTRLPDDLSGLDELTYLDISNNPLQNYDEVAKSLSTLPSLLNLKINLSNQNDAISILSALPNLAFLNGKCTKEETTSVDIDEKEIDNFSLNNEISKFDNIFNRVSEKLKPLGKTAVNTFFNDFQNILKNEINKINNLVEVDGEGNAVPNYLYAGEVLKSKIAIYSFFHMKLLNLLEKKDSEVAKILKDTLKFISESNNSMFDVMAKLGPKIEEKLDSYKSQCEEMIEKDSNKNRMKEEYEAKIAKLEEKLENSYREKEFFLNQNEEEKNILFAKISKLEDENKIMTDKLINKAKNISIEKDEVSKSGMVANKSSINLGFNNNSGDISQISNKGLVKSFQGGNVIVGPVGSRVLTKKMLLEIIDEIYTSKANFDKKCIENKMPLETMEQHMYTSLNQKYGLKNLIIEWATSIINGIRMFSPEDSEVCLFGKILRNELEEDSRIVISKLKTTISELLIYFLKAKNPLKTSADVKELALNRQSGVLSEEEWKGIIYYIFEKDDAQMLEAKINEVIKKKYLGHKEKSRKKMTREELQSLSKSKEDYKILFQDFLKIVLDHQIRLRDKYLRNFYYLFKKVDSDNNGIINEDEFIDLINLMDVYPKKNVEQTIDKLLNKIDPFNNKQMTFSQCVVLFSQDFIEDTDDQGNSTKLNVLDKISLNE